MPMGELAVSGVDDDKQGQRTKRNEGIVYSKAVQSSGCKSLPFYKASKKRYYSQPLDFQLDLAAQSRQHVCVANPGSVFALQFDTARPVLRPIYRHLAGEACPRCSVREHSQCAQRTLRQLMIPQPFENRRENAWSRLILRR